MVIEAGATAPEFSVDAAESGKTITQANGRRTVLVFHGNKTQDAPKTVGKAVREAFPEWQEVLVANIVNLKPFGGLWQKAAKAQIARTYEKLASKVDPAEEYVVICPDFENALGPLFGVDDSDQEAAIVVLDGDGNVTSSAAGGDLAAAAVAALS